MFDLVKARVGIVLEVMQRLKETLARKRQIESHHVVRGAAGDLPLIDGEEIK